MGLFLLAIGWPVKAQQLYEIMLAQTTNETKKGSVYQEIGTANFLQGNYDEAITLYKKKCLIYLKELFLQIIQNSLRRTTALVRYTSKLANIQTHYGIVKKH